MKKVMCLLAIMFMIANTSAQTRVIAHRGFWKTQGSAQNSITSLLKADSIGCYGSEFDVWLTKDNGLVVSHDGIIQGHKVEESTLKELTGLWLANGECVPSLKELLETANAPSGSWKRTAACSSATWAPARATACWKCSTPLKRPAASRSPTSSTRAALAISLSATPTPPRPRTSWAGWHSTALRTCAPTAGTGSRRTPTATTPQSNA